MKHPKLFLNEAMSLRYTAEVLYEFEKIKDTDEKNKKLFMFSDKLINRVYFPYKTIRMLMSFSLENIAKYMIVCDYKEKNPNSLIFPTKKIQTHKLEGLFNHVGYTISKENRLYINSWSKSAIWAGRYPLPISKNDMFKSRKIVEEGIGEIKVSFGNNKELVESDILYTNIQDIEYQTYIKMFEELKNMSLKYNKD